MVFDFTARKFLRREDLSIFIDHMITKNIVFYTSRNKQRKSGCSRCGVCVLLCVTLCPLWFAIILFGREYLWFVGLNVPRGCCVALPRGAMGLPAVCDCGIS